MSGLFMKWFGGPSEVGIAAVLAQFRREVVALFVFSAVINILQLAPTLYMLQVFDRVMISRNELTLVALTVLVMALYLLQGFCEWMRSRLIIAAGVQMDAVFSHSAFSAVFRDQLSRGDRAPTQTFSDLTQIRQWLTGQGAFAFFDLPWAPVYLAVMFMLHPLLGWLTIIFTVVLAGYAWWTGRSTRLLLDESEEEERELNSFIYSKLRNAEVIEAHGMVPNFLERWWARQVDLLCSQATLGDVNERLAEGAKQLRVIMQSLALGAGALLAIEGEISLGAMIAASFLMSRATSPIDQLAAGWKAFLQVKRCFERVDGLLKDHPPEPLEGVDDASSVTIELRSVSAFAYKRSKPILEDVSLTFRPGRVYAVIGNSGAGKTTLGKVISGVWPDARGEVLWNGAPMSRLNRHNIGPSIGYLPQEIELFGGTVGENIARMAEPVAEKVVAAAKLTGTHDLILRLPAGYDTPVGDGGSYLSGGQRQRVALARAFYGAPPLIVLDEPNSNLDEAGENALCQAVETARNQGATIVLITHRQGVMRVVDEVVAMSAGRVVSTGSLESAKQALIRPSESGASASGGALGAA